MDAGQRPRPRVVDGDDAGVGVRASQHLRVQHAAQLDVVGEGGVALREPQRIDLALWLADHSVCGESGDGHDAGAPASGPRLPELPIASCRGSPGRSERLDDRTAATAIGFSPRSSAAARRTASTTFT